MGNPRKLLDQNGQEYGVKFVYDVDEEGLKKGLKEVHFDIMVSLRDNNNKLKIHVQDIVSPGVAEVKRENDGYIELMDLFKPKNFNLDDQQLRNIREYIYQMVKQEKLKVSAQQIKLQNPDLKEFIGEIIIPPWAKKIETELDNIQIKLTELEGKDMKIPSEINTDIEYLRTLIANLKNPDDPLSPERKIEDVGPVQLKAQELFDKLKENMEALEKTFPKEAKPTVQRDKVVDRRNIFPKEAKPTVQRDKVVDRRNIDLTRLFRTPEKNPSPKLDPTSPVEIERKPIKKDSSPRNVKNEESSQSDSEFSKPGPRRR